MRAPVFGWNMVICSRSSSSVASSPTRTPPVVIGSVTRFIAGEPMKPATFGDLAGQPRFVEAYLWALDSLHRDGARATLEKLLGKDTP